MNTTDSPIPNDSTWLARRYRVLRRRILRVPANRQKRDLSRRLESGALERIEAPRALAASAFSMCGQKSFLDAVVMVRSFLRHVGAPPAFSFLSDGSLSDWHKERLEAIHPSVRVCDLTPFRAHVPPERLDLLEEKLPGYLFLPKLLVILAIANQQEPTLYTDSDIVFFPATDQSPLTNFVGELFYLPDCMASLDERLLLDATRGAASVNAGFGLFGRVPDWDGALEPLRALSGAPNHVSEQTLVHNMMHLNGAHALPAERFVLRVDDMLMRHDGTLGNTVVMRHYVGMVRHKMWLLTREFYT